MALTVYCEPDEIRAALGVNEDELSNTVLNLPVYSIGLIRELNKVSVSLPVAFSVEEAVAEETRTDLGQALMDATRLFAVYATARQVGVSLGVMAPKDIGDGKATLSRFSDSPYRDTLARIDAMYAATKASLLDALNSYNNTTEGTASTVPYTFFKASIRSFDPVTGV
jgi:hypothetical protein